MVKRYGIVLVGGAILVVAVLWRLRSGDPPVRPAAIPERERRPAEPAPVSLPATSPGGNEPKARTAWRDGYRAAPSEGGTRSLSGWVTAGGVPQPFQDVFVEWVFSFDTLVAPTTSVEVRVDPEGTRWSRKTLRTNREGFFSADGLPDVQLRVQVGPRVFPMSAAANVRIACD